MKRLVRQLVANRMPMSLGDPFAQVTLQWF